MPLGRIHLRPSSRGLHAQCWHGPSCAAHAAHGLAGLASRRGPRARGRRCKSAHATTSARARARVALALARQFHLDSNFDKDCSIVFYNPCDTILLIYTS
jgi:hypothetical protein